MASIVTAIAFAGACKSSGADNPNARPSEVLFPSAFLWGTSTAAFQIEKGNAHTDWGHWVSVSGKIRNGDTPDKGGPDALAHIDEDIALMKAEGHNA